MRIDFMKLRKEAAETNQKLSNRENFAFLSKLSTKRLKLIEQGDVDPYPDEAAIFVKHYKSIELANALCRECPINKERKILANEEKNTK